MGLFRRSKKKKAQGAALSFPEEIQQLREDGSDQAVARLMERVRQGPDQKQALFALLTMDAAQAAELVRETLGDYAYGDNVRIAQLLLETPCEALYDAIVDVYLQQYFYIRNELIGFISKDRNERCAQALIAFMGDDESCDEARERLFEIAPQRMEEGLDNAYRHGNSRTRLMVSHQLMALGGERAVEALAHWDWDGDFDAMMEGAANLTLLYDEAPEAVEALLAGEAADKAPVVLAAGLRMGRYDEQQARKALDSADSALRYVGVRTLLDREMADKTQIMGKALADTDDRVRRVGIRYFMDYPAKEALLGLMDALSAQEEQSRRLAALALGKLGDQAAAGALIVLLRDDEARVRAAAAEALGALESRTAVDALLACLEDEKAVVRQMAAQALGEIGDMRAVDRLMEALRDDDVDVIKAVNGSLARIQTSDALK
ncbi:MAG: HEAT repeat domain-containing protein [Christensenellales bacterium]